VSLVIKASGAYCYHWTRTRIDLHAILREETITWLPSFTFHRISLFIFFFFPIRLIQTVERLRNVHAIPVPMVVCLREKTPWILLTVIQGRSVSTLKKWRNWKRGKHQIRLSGRKVGWLSVDPLKINTHAHTRNQRQPASPSLSKTTFTAAAKLGLPLLYPLPPFIPSTTLTLTPCYIDVFLNCLIVILNCRMLARTLIHCALQWVLKLGCAYPL
jgi:hypothetical protein